MQERNTIYNYTIESLSQLTQSVRSMIGSFYPSIIASGAKHHSTTVKI